MTDAYRPLPLRRLESGTRHFCPGQPMLRRVTADDPAASVMTDLGRVTAWTVERSTPLVEGLRIMRERGVRILLVCDADRTVVGALTGRDIAGEKPGRIMAKAGCGREALLVVDVMTIRPKLEALSMEDVSRARVGDIIATLRHADRQHALVLDDDPETGQPAVRGLFSLPQIGLRLGLDIDPPRQPITYAEPEKAGGAL